MSIIAKAEGDSGFSPIPEGAYTAICYGIVDLGMQYSEQFKKSAHKILIMWELPDEQYIDEEGNSIPRVISREYSLSLGEKATLRKDLQAWRGKAFTEEELEGFDMKNVAGKGCQLQIIHKENSGKTYANIAGIMGLPKGFKTTSPIHELVWIDLEDEETIKNIIKLPEWIQKKIKASETYAAISNVDNENMDTALEEEAEDDLPF